MQNISIGRFDKDPTAQGVIRPEDNSWQLVLDKDGYPHLYLQVDVEDDAGKPTKGLLCLDDMLHEGVSVRDLMAGGIFQGRLTPEEEERAYEEVMRDRAEKGIPCPR